MQDCATPLASSLVTMMLGKTKGGKLDGGRLLMLKLTVEHQGQQAMLGPGAGRSQSKHETA